MTWPLRYTSLPIRALLLSAVLNFPVRAQHADHLELARDGATSFTIVRPARAPQSVIVAAEELQAYLTRATGATMPIETDAIARPAGIISVGQTAQATAYELDAAELRWEGFRIVSRGGSLFILGRDTADRAKTPEGGTSHGTANGVYTFLEDYVGVRWLIPGRLGDDVPHVKHLTIRSVDRTDAPHFLSRDLSYMQTNEPAVAQWSRRQKLGFSLRVAHQHNWEHVVPPGMFEKHPEWFAEVGGKRLPPTHRYKLDPTDRGLIEHFAQTAIEAFRKDRGVFSFSLSPTDGSYGWGDSPATQALMEKDPHGRLSRTPLILNFYNEVAKIVGREFPDRKLCGYIYASYMYPPKAGIPKLEPNLMLMVATSISYGYQQYRPGVREDWENIMGAWTRATDQVGYYDILNWLRFQGGTLTPPAPEILNSIFHRVADMRVKTIDLHAPGEWSHAGVNNYVQAKLAWNPRLDAVAVCQEFYRRAYGESAGATMAQLYQALEAAVKAYYIREPTAGYVANWKYMQQVIAPFYSTAERHYLAAERAVETANEAQRARLRFFGDNLILMQWRLRVAGLLPERTDSPLYRSADVIQSMIERPEPDFGVRLGWDIRNGNERQGDRPVAGKKVDAAQAAGGRADLE